jgi:protease I
MQKLNGKKIAILVCDGFEESELSQPYSALKDAGAAIDIISPNEQTVNSWHFNDWGKVYHVDVMLDEAEPRHYDALILPGGVINPDRLRTIVAAVNFVRYFLQHNKMIAAICHGPWTLIETGLITGRHMTSYHSIKTDLINAGVNWSDQAVVVDRNLITSRSPNDIPAFVTKMIEYLMG